MRIEGGTRGLRIAQMFHAHVSLGASNLAARRAPVARISSVGMRGGSRRNDLRHMAAHRLSRQRKAYQAHILYGCGKQEAQQKHGANGGIAMNCAESEPASEACKAK